MWFHTGLLLVKFSSMAKPVADGAGILMMGTLLEARPAHQWKGALQGMDKVDVQPGQPVKWISLQAADKILPRPAPHKESAAIRSFRPKLPVPGVLH